jgi:hypothetical protein
VLPVADHGVACVEAREHAARSVDLDDAAHVERKVRLPLCHKVKREERLPFAPDEGRAEYRFEGLADLKGQKFASASTAR